MKSEILSHEFDHWTVYTFNLLYIHIILNFHHFHLKSFSKGKKEDSWHRINQMWWQYQQTIKRQLYFQHKHENRFFFLIHFLFSMPKAILCVCFACICNECVCVCSLGYIMTENVLLINWLSVHFVWKSCF